ncbi:serine/threonine-protein phosphatase 6 regulatory ankyrin repeat subunit B-like [Magallana gigas]|uniref:serine/threonine-protein phosphatase 6 regulatory ankyrin repeat subunit B-like n=1 Tax=Magallana gigas TaxID=29159 RepID=UPI003340BF61
MLQTSGIWPEVASGLKTLGESDVAGAGRQSPLDKAIFQQWQEDNSQFVSTRACKEVEKRIESQNLVIVIGNSGSGKSAIIQHIALRYRVKGWTVKPVYNVKEITATYSSVDVLQSKILFVFNDPIGNESFDEIAYNSWKEQDERLKACLRYNKMLLSSRKYILLDNRVKGMLNDKSCSIDLSDDKHKLNNGEKETILRSYASNSGLLKDDISGILTTEEYFPLLCKLYFSDRNNQTIGPRFFKEPFNVCQEQIRNFRNDSKKESKNKYCALVLLVLCNNQLCVEDIQEKDCLQEKFKLALKLCEMTNTASHTIGDALKTLEGFFVKKIDDTYHFYHDFVMEVTTYVFGTDYPRETIQYADIGFLRRRVNLKSSNGNGKEVDIFTIYLNDKHVSDLADRLFNDVFGDRLLDVVLNPCVRNEKVAKCFIQKLKDNPEKLHNLLAKKQLQEKFRKEEKNQELKQSFGSKLEFLYAVDKVQILSAIIVFCHTNVSKHCLETLQRMQNSLKDTSLFSAVCCNGSMDLFNVFPKEQIKWFLEKKWGELYPIHIASLFHNHEILRTLIQVKNNVNLRIGTQEGCTPLMLAVYNTDTSEQKNKETKKQPIDITVELLLTHGADINFCVPFWGSPLHIASGRGNNHTVELLLDKGADTNSCDTNKETPLHKASECGHDSSVQFLLDKGADINSCDLYKETPLHKASKKGHESTVQLLLDKGADINSCDKHKETPLHKASECGHESTVQLLLDKGADINSCDKHKETPLHKASEWERESTVQFLLDKGADINSCDTNRETPLHKASKMGHESTVQLLLDKGADINSCDKHKKTPLHKASECGHESTVQLLLDKGADINSCDKHKKTPLHKASEWGHDRMVQLLLDKGADINSCDTYNETPLHKASECGHRSTVQLLLDNGANIHSCNTYKETPLHKASEWVHNKTVPFFFYKGAYITSCDTNKETPIHKASKHGDDSIVQLLLEKGAIINSCDTNKETPLHKASKKGHESIVQFLLEKGAYINSCDTNKETPLHKASKKGHESIVQFLLEKGAYINSCNTNKETPLHKASEFGHRSTVQFLLDKGADINSCDKNKKTPLHKASECGHDSSVQLLLDNGADFNSCDKNKETPLHKPSEFGYERIVHLLVYKGADINSRDKHKKTPLHKASEYGHRSTVQFLLDNGADFNSRDTNKETPLHKASQFCHWSTVQLLLDKGANINSCDTNK